MSDWSERMAAKVAKQMNADRDESYAAFKLEMLKGLEPHGYAIPETIETTMHRSYDIGYVDACNALLRRGVLNVEKLL